MRFSRGVLRWLTVLVAGVFVPILFTAWTAYSTAGVLGLMWRTNQPGPGPTFPYNIWAAVSRDGGALAIKLDTFAAPGAGRQ